MNVPSADSVVQATNDDATVSRCSASQAGYFHDPFVSQLVRRPARRSPVINRGTYCRLVGLQNLIRQFLDACRNQQLPSQIVSLGAGFDTTYFLLKTDQKAPNHYFEVDFAETTAKKVMSIQRKSALKTILEDGWTTGNGGTELWSYDYTVIAGDLRGFETTVVPALERRGFDRTLPTLFLSECVLIYLDPTHSDAIIRWVSQHVPTAMFTTYEPIGPHDAFGQMMVQNLEMRRIELKGLLAYPDLASQQQRYYDLGWPSAQAMDMATLYAQLPPGELQRLMRIEILDELEEFNLFGRHYCIAWAWQSRTLPLLDPLTALDPSKPTPTRP
ncbi:carboxy methyl transferase for protein phosphatase 2A [Dimargaris verticillata]|uniref:Leucine carboxyl methyltransferase 1 n=1 Tax=Dimargaris verticillata TaxID=2761393 RepID=A0A9W8ECQ1_9FUNG|nr:carboxy methyl transferase for protein phosphatase 2A [Dimargaris verticillata]